MLRQNKFVHGNYIGASGKAWQGREARNKSSCVTHWARALGVMLVLENDVQCMYNSRPGVQGMSTIGSRRENETYK